MESDSTRHWSPVHRDENLHGFAARRGFGASREIRASSRVHDREVGLENRDEFAFPPRRVPARSVSKAAGEIQQSTRVDPLRCVPSNAMKSAES